MCFNSITSCSISISQKFGKLLDKYTSQIENLMCDKMIELDVKKLTSCNSDWEMNQYTLLRIVKNWESNFRKNKLYPYLNESIELQRKLQDVLQENLESKWWLEREIRPRKINDHYVAYEKAQQVSNQLDQLLSFVRWALQINRPVMEEGIIIKEFIEESIKIEPINDEPNYLGKGYFSLEDNKKLVLNIYSYDMNWEWSGDEPKNTLKIQLVRSIPLLVINGSVEDLMKDFIAFSQPLFKPMAYVFSGELDCDFPYEATICPIAGESLLKILMS